MVSTLCKKLMKIQKKNYKYHRIYFQCGSSVTTKSQSPWGLLKITKYSYAINKCFHRYLGTERVTFQIPAVACNFNDVQSSTVSIAKLWNLTLEVSRSSQILKTKKKRNMFTSELVPSLLFLKVENHIS